MVSTNKDQVINSQRWSGRAADSGHLNKVVTYTKIMTIVVDLLVYSCDTG